MKKKRLRPGGWGEGRKGVRRRQGEKRKEVSSNSKSKITNSNANSMEKDVVPFSQYTPQPKNTWAIHTHIKYTNI